MKKYLVLVTLSICVILTVFATGYSRVNDIEYVSAIRVEKTTAVLNLTYNGTVEYSNAVTASAASNGMVQSVLVSNGEYVSAGEPILIVYETDADITSREIMSAIAANDYDKLKSLLQSDSSLNIYYAEKNGIISSLSADENLIYQKGQTLFKISQEDSFQIQINVLEKDISKIKTGQNVSIECKALDKKLHGQVKSIDKSARQTASSSGKETTVRVIIEIEEQSEQIKSGYTATCVIKAEEKNDVLLIPYVSLNSDEEDNSFVYLYNNGVAEKRFVTCEQEYDAGVEVTQGLKEGDIIIADAAEVKNPEKTVVDEVASYEK